MAGLPISQNVSLLNSIRRVLPKGNFIANVERENHPMLQFFMTSKLPKPFSSVTAEGIQLLVETRPGNGSLQTEDMFQKTAPSRGGTLETASWSTFRQIYKLAFDEEELRINSDGGRNPEKLYNYALQKRARISADTCDQWDSHLTFGPRSLALLGQRNPRGILQCVGFSMNQSTGAYVANPDGGFTGQRYRLMSGEVVTLRDGIDPTLPENPWWRNWTATDDEVGMSFALVDKIDLAASRTNFTASTVQVVSSEAVDAPKKVASPENNDTFERKHVIALGERRYRAAKQMFALGRETIGNDPYVSLEGKRLANHRFFCVRRLDEVFGNPIIGLSREHIGMWKFPGMWEMPIKENGVDGSDTTMVEGFRWIGQALNSNPRQGCFVIHNSF